MAIPLQKDRITTPQVWALCAALSWTVVIGCAPEDPGIEGAPDSTATAAHVDAAPDGYTVYRNDRFDYSVVYPTSLLNPAPESQNGDGRRFFSPDSSMVLTAFGRHLTEADSSIPSLSQHLLDERIAALRGEPGLVTYSAGSDSAFVVSGTRGDVIYYEKTLVSQSTLARIEFVYPIAERVRLDSVVTTMSHSFGGQVMPTD